MKLLAIFLLVGVALATHYDDLDKATNEVVKSFMEGMDQAVPLRIALNMADDKSIDETEDDNITDLGKRLKKHLERILEKINVDLENGRMVKENTLDKLRDIIEDLRALKLDIGENSKELLQKVKDKTKGILKKLLEKIGMSKRSLTYGTENSLSELSLREMLQQLKNQLLEKIDKEEVKEKIVKILGQGTELVEQLLKTLKEKGKQKVIDLIDHLLGNYTDRRERSLSELWEKVKDYFKDFNIDLKVKFLKFGEWIRESIGKGLEISKDKLTNIRAIGKEFVKHAKGVSKEIAGEALEFFRQYKDELGDLWNEIKDVVNESLNKN